MRLGLCLACRGRLEPLRQPGCAGCGRPLLAAALPAGYFCGGCRRRPPAYDRLLAPWAYRPPLVEVVQALKFGRLGFLGAHLATEIWHRHGGELRAHEVVVPVPLHWRRRLGRGYNQADEIARPLARRLGRPRLEALARTRATPAQSSLDRQRRLRNLRGAFRLRRGRRAAIAGRRVLLVDDVVTTGATLHQAAATLRRAGARSVAALVAARTPLASDG